MLLSTRILTLSALAMLASACVTTNEDSALDVEPTSAELDEPSDAAMLGEETPAATEEAPIEDAPMADETTPVEGEGEAFAEDATLDSEPAVEEPAPAPAPVTRKTVKPKPAKKAAKSAKAPAKKKAR